MKNQYDTRGSWLAEHVLPHEPGLRSWLRRSARLSDADIDDLIQETYANLFTRPSVAEIADPRAYTYQVARSILLQNLRRAKIVTIEAVADVSSLLFSMNKEFGPDLMRARFVGRAAVMPKLSENFGGKCASGLDPGPDLSAYGCTRRSTKSCSATTNSSTSRARRLEGLDSG